MNKYNTAYVSSLASFKESYEPVLTRCLHQMVLQVATHLGALMLSLLLLCLTFIAQSGWWILGGGVIALTVGSVGGAFIGHLAGYTAVYSGLLRRFVNRLREDTLGKIMSKLIQEYSFLEDSIEGKDSPTIKKQAQSALKRVFSNVYLSIQAQFGDAMHQICFKIRFMIFCAYGGPAFVIRMFSNNSTTTVEQALVHILIGFSWGMFWGWLIGDTSSIMLKLTGKSSKIAQTHSEKAQRVCQQLIYRRIVLPSTSRSGECPVINPHLKQQLIKHVSTAAFSPGSSKQSGGRNSRRDLGLGSGRTHPGGFTAEYSHGGRGGHGGRLPSWLGLVCRPEQAGESRDQQARSHCIDQKGLVSKESAHDSRMLILWVQSNDCGGVHSPGLSDCGHRHRRSQRTAVGLETGRLQVTAAGGDGEHGASGRSSSGMVQRGICVCCLRSDY